MKILILTASPLRDKLIDELIAEELTSRGHEVVIKPCLREGRKAVLEMKPDIVVVPPIRNAYSRDFVETLKYHGVGVVSRHTEASCDWQDYKAMSDLEKRNIMGNFPYIVDKELVWSNDEAQILARRGTPFPVIPVGAIGLDIYKNIKNVKHKKKTLLIACPWGFADSAPDLNIEEMVKAKHDEEGKKRHIKFIKAVAKKCDWKIIVTLHPGVDPKEYREQLDVEIDTETVAAELLRKSDVLVHSGSTMAIEMHMLDKPAFQYQDVNIKVEAGWWSNKDTPLSNVSPKIKNAGDLIKQLDGLHGSNANLEAIEALEKGRYGRMDGLAYKRAADQIETVKGKWTDKWPRSQHDYDQPVCMKSLETAVKSGVCGICGGKYHIIDRDWLQKTLKILEIEKDVNPLYQIVCPNCGSKFYLPWQQ